MTPRIRIKTDFTVNWSFVRRDDTPFSLLDSDITLVLVTPRGKSEIENYNLSGNTLTWTFLGERQKLLGTYSLRISLKDGTDGNEYSLDLIDVFRLIGRGENENWDGGSINKTSRVLTLTNIYKNYEVDTDLSIDSVNPVQNKIVTNALNKRPTTQQVINLINDYASKGTTSGGGAVSPTITLKSDSKGVTITVKDVNGTSSARILNGSGGSGVDLDVLLSYLAKKQDKLVSGTNIKTINGNSLLGNGNIVIEGGTAGSSTTVFRYSNWEGTGSVLPQTPDENASIWHTIRHTEDKWSAIGVSNESGSGYNWNIIRLVPESQTATEKTVTQTKVSYGISNSALSVPSVWSTDESEITGFSGQYFWTRTEYVYSDGTSEVITIPTRFGQNGTNGKDGKNGKDGINGTDGKDGTSVNIKGGLDSMSMLPTSGASLGDGYLIDGYLWVYTATTKSDATHYRGFENVGLIKGEKGDTGARYYIHYAWANSSNGSVDFAVEPEAGKHYAYIGVYCDTVEKDLDKPGSYEWSHIAGKDGADGQKGDKGNDGVTYFTHFAWADTLDNSDNSFTVSNPSGKSFVYVGTCRTHNDKTKSSDVYYNPTGADPTTMAMYKWIKVKGEDGAIGKKGEKGDDGMIPCTHIAWMNTLDNSDNSFSAAKQAGASYKYMGVYTHYVTDLEAAKNDPDPDPKTDSNALGLYTWVAVQAEPTKVTIGPNRNWFIDGVDSGISSVGDRGPSIIYGGVYDPDDRTRAYYGNSKCLSVVFYDGKYWIANPASKDVDADGTFYGYGNEPGKSGNWSQFGTTFDNIATGMVWSENVITEVLQAFQARIDELTATKLRTADQGERIDMTDNTLKLYDSDGDIVGIISGNEHATANVENTFVASISNTAINGTYTTVEKEVVDDEGNPTGYTSPTSSESTSNLTLLQLSYNSLLKNNERCVISGTVPLLDYSYISGSVGYSDVLWITAQLMLVSDSNGATMPIGFSQSGGLVTEPGLTGTMENEIMVEGATIEGESVEVVSETVDRSFSVDIADFIKDNCASHSGVSLVLKVTSRLTQSTSGTVSFRFQPSSFDVSVTREGCLLMMNTKGFKYTLGPNSYAAVTTGDTYPEIRYRAGKTSVNMNAQDVRIRVGNMLYIFSENGLVEHPVVNANK